MIKFFRRIRKKFLEENRLSKYLVYAGGEIVLVMIGILLALQVSNWNENRINSQREANYIRNIERDLENQLRIIDLQIKSESEAAKHCEAVLVPYRKNGQFTVDSTFALAIAGMTNRRTFSNTNPTYKELISSGNIQLIRNETFKNQLLTYYDELERIEKVIEKNNSLFVDQEFVPAMLKYGVLDDRVYVASLGSLGESRDFGNGISESNIKHLLGIGHNLLKKEENELFMVNQIVTRRSLVKLHIYICSTFKEETKKILIALKDSYK